MNHISKFQVALASGLLSGSLGYVIAVKKEGNLRLRHAHAATALTDQERGLVLPDVASLARLKPEAVSGITAQLAKVGYPSYDSVRVFDDFVLAYDRRSRNPLWVFEHLTPAKVTKNPEVDRAKCQFSEDPNIHPFFRSTNADYKGSGFDRGHMAAAGNHRQSQALTNETFALSNMCPQVGKGFNRDKWNDLEQYVRHAARHSTNTFVCTGPLYLPLKGPDGKSFVTYQVLGGQQVAVPTHFFKVVLSEKAGAGVSEWSLESYVLPNRPIPAQTPLSTFLVPLDSIERSAGFIIFEGMPQKQLTSINGQKKGRLW